MAQIIHTSTGASNTGAAVDVNALTLPGISSLDSLFEIDSGVVLDGDGLGVTWYNKAPSWGSGWAEYMRGTRTLLDTEAPLSGYPTLDFPKYPYQTYSQMLVPTNKYLLSNAGYTPAPEKRKHTICAVFKNSRSNNYNYILSGVTGYGYTPGFFSLMGIRYNNVNNDFVIITRYTYHSGGYTLAFPYPSWYNDTDWTIFIWNYNMASGNSIVYLNGIKIFDGYFKTALSLGNASHPEPAGIGLDGNYGGQNFVGKYAAVACWNYNLEADEDFFLNTTNYFATKYGITI